jgi:hypothetical protein
MKTGYRRFVDVIEAVGLSAVITDRIPIPIGVNRVHGISCQPPPDLDGVYIDKKLIYLSCFNSGPTPHFSISCFNDET